MESEQESKQESEHNGGAMRRIRAFWRRVLTGPTLGARIEAYEEIAPGLGAGIGIREVLRTAAERHRGAKRRSIEILADGVAADRPLAATMLAHPECYSAIEAALVATGERTGRLDAAFRSAAAQLERERDTRNRLVQACAYPFVLIHCLILIPALGLIAASRGVLAYLAFVVPALLLLWGSLFAVASVFAAFSHRVGFARFVDRLPIIGKVVKAAALARFARSLAALHGAGITYDESLRASAEASGHALIRADADVAIYAIRRGATFPVALDEMTSLPSDDRSLLVAGERSGELESAARRVAEMEDQRFEVVTKRAIAVLPSVLIGIVGVAVAVLMLKVVGGYYKTLTSF